MATKRDAAPRPPEPRVPTHLVPARPRTSEGSPAALFRIGPYDVLRALVRGPGAWLVEARTPAGDPVLLQLAHLRAPRGAADPMARHQLERSLAAATAQLFSEAEVQVSAHGGVDRDDGARVLFWALPWRVDADRLAYAALYVERVENLVSASVALTRRLARRHVLGRLEPLLSEHFVIVRPGGADLACAPLHVPPGWLAPETPSPRLAPEELASGRVDKKGDLWRLGHALTGLAAEIGGPPSSLAGLFERLLHADPEARPPRATEVLVELEALQSRLERGLQLTPPPGTSRTVRLDVLGPEDLSALLLAASGESTQFEPADPLEPFLPVPLRRLSESTSEVAATAPGEEAATERPGEIAWAPALDDGGAQTLLELVSRELTWRELHLVGAPADAPTLAARAARHGGQLELTAAGAEEAHLLDLTELAAACQPLPAEAWPSQVRGAFDRLLVSTAELPVPLASELPSEAEETLDTAAPHRPDPDPRRPPRGPVTEPGAPEVALDTGRHEPSDDEGGPTALIAADDALAIAYSHSRGQPVLDGPSIAAGEVSAIAPPHGHGEDRGDLDGASVAGDDALAVESLEIIAELPKDTLVDHASPLLPEHLPAALAPSTFPVEEETLTVRRRTTPRSPSAAREPLGSEIGAAVRARVPLERETSTGVLLRQVVGSEATVPLGARAEKRAPAQRPTERPQRPPKVFAALIALALLGGVTLAARERGQVRGPEISAAHVVTLEVSPPSAVVTSEVDGRVLGRGPLRFAVAPGAELPVLVAADGFEPQRIVLPDRGLIATTLAPLPADARLCTVRFSGAAPALEVLGSGNADAGALELRGAVVVRAQAGARAGGAWLVRCPELGGAPEVQLSSAPPRSASLRFEAPAGARVFADGRELGPLPATHTTRQAFTEVRLELPGGASQRYWVSSRGDARVSLPGLPAGAAARSTESAAP